MSDILMDASTGFIPVDELVELAAEPDEIAVGTILQTTAVITAATAISAALQGACPTSGITPRCV
ncbi:hypothetical protein ACIG5E_33090 [Kitasatospora sp. NPDC053057]|uniref:hypothetical protein n=1 Tax=Kitasatospora sp. NPDC053057 TaxID=3364062 RepID=UPI0037C8D631